MIILSFDDWMTVWLNGNKIGMKGRGFILSSACALAPGTPLENLDALYEIIEKYGYY